ncbi:hypothetical protein PDESU_03780 [Pontiella desulfatans]|uniref:PIN domain-containing protein n=1 Tax=Pontiella desulfatans TaxID=2750659 RepID=A0A6C2U557_PONDE|nr:type II toxin-antitoxin system VapC family toxin [Pontiella desulfatans]VGO15198.1 hypothetical protein PDESU_03780 [Pontiella desulfatans]
MELILDTCGFLSLVGLAERELSEVARQSLEEAETVYAMSCSLFEIAIKHKKGNIGIQPFESAMVLWETAIKEYCLTELPVSGKAFFESTQLSDHHADAFDRIIIAESLGRDIPIVTYDSVFSHYGVETIN